MDLAQAGLQEEQQTLPGEAESPEGKLQTQEMANDPRQTPVEEGYPGGNSLIEQFQSEQPLMTMRDGEDPDWEAERLDRTVRPEYLPGAEWNAKQKDFLKQTGLKRQGAKEEAAGWDGKKAYWAGKEYAETVRRDESAFQEFYRGLSISSNKRRDQEILKKYVDKASSGGRLRPSDERLLEVLQKTGEWVEVNSTEADIYSLGALTSKTGVEFASFTKGDSKYILRGSSIRTDIPEDLAREIFSKQLRWEGHSHPTTTGPKASSEDRNTLKLFTWQKKSSIIDLSGTVITFTPNQFEDIRRGRERN